MQKFLHDILTGPDGESYELAHIVWVIGVLVFIGIVLFISVKTGQYPTNFGQDFAALNIGGGIGSLARSKSDVLK